MHHPQRAGKCRGLNAALTHGLRDRARRTRVCLRRDAGSGCRGRFLGLRAVRQLRPRQGQPKPEMEQRAIKALQSDPQMRQAFFAKVSAPIVSKMFECGMIP